MPIICRNCNQEAQRVVTVFEIDGKPLPEPKDSCEHCKDGGLHTNPAWMYQRPVPGWEAKPHLYRKVDRPDGTQYEAKDELRQDTEDQLCKQPEEELRAGVIAQEEKRQHRRTDPMTPDELAAAINKARSIGNEILLAHQQAEIDRQIAAEEQWKPIDKQLRAN